MVMATKFRLRLTFCLERIASSRLNQTMCSDPAQGRDLRAVRAYLSLFMSWRNSAARSARTARSPSPRFCRIPGEGLQ